jgi:hypothetical protein
MGEEHNNFVDFIEKVKDMDYQDIIDYGEKEISEMESISHSNNGADIDGIIESAKYSKQIKAFLSFMSKGMKPAGVSAYDFRLYRIVVEFLVAKEQMKPEAIEIFFNSK